MTHHRPSGFQKAVRLDDVPRARFGQMLTRTILGFLFIGVGIWGMAREGMNQYLAVSLIGLGAHIWSTRLVNNALMAMLGPIKSVIMAWRGTSDE